MKVGVISAFKHKPSQQKLQEEKKPCLLRTVDYRSLADNEYNHLSLFGPLFLGYFLISSFLPCVCVLILCPLSPHLGIFCVQEYSGTISFTSHYLLSALPLTASTGFAESLLVIGVGKTPGGCYCIKKYRGILTLSIAALISVPGSVFSHHLKADLSRKSWFAK